MKDHLYYTYILASRSHNFYVGMTSEIETRMRQHKAGRFDGFSKRYNCNRLVLLERHGYVHEAISREKQLKGWTRKKKIWLIERSNPGWVDLSEEWGKMSPGYQWTVEEREAMAKADAAPSTAELTL